MEPIHIRFIYSPENLQAANQLHYKKNYPVRGKILLWFGVLLLWTGVLFLYYNRNSGNQLMSYTFLAYGIIVIAVHFYIMKTMGRRLFRKHRDRVAPIDIEIDEEKILFQSGEQRATVPWNEIVKACMADNTILLYITKMSFYIFPKENFSGNDFETFAVLVKEKVQTIK